MKKILILLTALVVAVCILITVQIVQLKPPLQVLQDDVRQVTILFEQQNLSGANDQLAKVVTDLTQVEKIYSNLSWTKFVPIVNWYYDDGQRALTAGKNLLLAGKIVTRIEVPKSDDKFDFYIRTLDKLKPQLNEVSKYVALANSETSAINLNHYPIQINRFKVRSQVETLVTFVNQLNKLMTEARPILETAPYILGLDAPRKYLVIFQNDAELRPTGGFTTAYALMTVDHGVVKTDFSDNIYDLDAKLKERTPAPEPIKRYLPNVPYWYLRDRNLSPDLKMSLGWFYPDYLKTKDAVPVDGIITIDTQLFVDLLRVTGPIKVENVGTLTADIDKRCNCPQAFYELELQADVENPVLVDRKAFIGPAMNALTDKILTLPTNKAPELFNTLMRSLSAKHLQVYFSNSQIQTSAEAFNIAGRVRSWDQDYLMIVDTNFAGAKTNAWVTYDAFQKIEVAGDGSIVKTLTLTYKNPQKDFQDLKTKLRLNGIFRDWLRIYVPMGSILVEPTKGFETGEATSEDLGKTVFEGFFTLTPLNTKTITFKYKLPFKTQKPYNLLIQKQAGSKNFMHKLTINGKSQEIILDSDKELSL